MENRRIVHMYSRTNLITIKITFVWSTLPWVKRVNLIIVTPCRYNTHIWVYIYVSTVLQYFNAIINVNRMLICIPCQPWNMIFGQPVCARLTFGLQLNIIFCLLYNSTRLSSTCLWGAKTCFSFRCQPRSLSPKIPVVRWTLCATVSI